MNKIIGVCVLSFSFLVATAQEYSLKSSQWKWTGKDAFSAYSLSGTLDQKSGMMTLSDQTLTAGEIIIDMSSLDAENKDLRMHLRSADFFEVKKYKEAKFVLTSGNIYDKTAIIEGKLTIKDKTNEKTIKPDVKEVAGEIILSGQLIIDRTKYGVVYNSPNIFKNLKDNAIADDFTLDYELVFLPE